MTVWIELGVNHEDGGTCTVEHFEDLTLALKALYNHEDDTSFIDFWNESGSNIPDTTGFTITKKDLIEITKG